MASRNLQIYFWKSENQHKFIIFELSLSGGLRKVHTNSLSEKRGRRDFKDFVNYS